MQRLLQIKETIYTNYNYKKMNDHLRATYSGPENVDFGYYNVEDFKDKIKNNDERHRVQERMIERNDITNELNLPSIATMVKDYRSKKEAA